MQTANCMKPSESIKLRSIPKEDSGTKEFRVEVCVDAFCNCFIFWKTLILVMYGN